MYELLNKGNSSTPSPAEFQDGTVRITEPSQITGKDFFINVGPCLVKYIGNACGSPIDYINKYYPHLNTFEPVKPSEALMIMNLKDAAAGHGEITPYLIKNFAPSITDPLSFIFSLSVESDIISQGSGSSCCSKLTIHLYFQIIVLHLPYLVFLRCFRS